MNNIYNKIIAPLTKCAKGLTRDRYLTAVADKGLSPDIS